MSTYRGGSGWSSSTWPASPGTADTTEWIYHEASGLLTAKKDAVGKQVSYTYAAGGKLASRTWSRVNGTNSLVTSYSYSDSGDLSAIDYSDSTPDISFTYDRLGRQKTASSSISDHTFAYNGLLLDTETIVSSAGTNIIDRSYDGYGRSTGFALDSDYSVAYGYDSLGRFSQISNVQFQVSYSYLANSDLISTIANGDIQTTRTYEQNRNLLTQIKNQVNSTILSQFDYANDSGGRRTSIKYSGSAFETGAAFNKYGYNSRSEVVSGKRYWGSDLGDLSQPVSGQDYGYEFDNIGNRSATTVNGEPGTYTANSLNQYAQRTVPDVADILGSASTNSMVKVNTLAVNRHGKYWHKGLTVTNSVNAAYSSVEVIGIDTNSTTNTLYSIETGHVFVAKTPETFSYDDDGNLLSGGRFNYSWECENRLISAETLSTLPASVPRKKLDFAYDYMSRRVSKTVYAWNSSSNEFQVSSVNSFVYDGWNLIREITVTPTPPYSVTNSYVWGLDLSGTLQGAGGIGGLVSVTRSTCSGTATYYPCYDGNGNISDYVDTNGVVVAHREYDPFGNTVVATGPMVNDFNFWFSTKYLDHETGLYYYGYRYYSPAMGRWLNHDPIGEEGGVNYYAFVLNNTPNLYDLLGESIGEIACEAIPIGGRICGNWGPWIGPVVVGGVVLYIATRYCIEVWQDYKEECEKCVPKAAPYPISIPETKTRTKKDEKRPPCTPYGVGTTGYRGPDPTPDDAPAFAPRPVHYHLYIVNQDPAPPYHCHWNDFGPHYSAVPGQVNCNGGYPPLSP